MPVLPAAAPAAAHNAAFRITPRRLSPSTPTPTSPYVLPHVVIVLFVFLAAVRPRSNSTGHSLRVHPPLQTRRGHAASGSKVCPTTAFPLLQLTHCPRAGWRRLAIPSPPTSPCSCSSSSSQGPPPPPLPAHAQAHLLTHPPVTRSAIPAIEYDFTHSM